MSLKIFIIACEASGDSHGAHLAQEIKKLNPDCEFRGLGGPKMRESGVQIYEDMTAISALGLGDVLSKYGTFRKIFYETLEKALAWKPDALVLIDSPAFNLRFAKKIRRRFPVFYYISPQLWAWGARRIATIKKTISKMLVILPFETGLYEKAGIPCEFVGHPLLDQIKISADRETLRARFGIKPGEQAIGLLPGSRESEVRRILPIMLKTAVLVKGRDPRARLFLTQASNVSPGLYEKLLAPYHDLGIHSETKNFYDLIAALDFALVTSGTATLETALIGTPFFLLYKTNWSTYVLARKLVQVPFLGLANILADKFVVPEFLQDDADPEKLSAHVRAFLSKPDLSQKMRAEFTAIKEMLGSEGASRRAAKTVISFLTGQNLTRETHETKTQ